jgi:hypothetical protein
LFDNNDSLARQVLPVLVPVYKPNYTVFKEVVDSLARQKKSPRFTMVVYFFIDDVVSDIEFLLGSLRSANVTFFVIKNEFNLGQWVIYNRFSLDSGNCWFFILHQDDVVVSDWFLVLSDEILRSDLGNCATISPEWDRFSLERARQELSSFVFDQKKAVFEVFIAPNLNNLFYSGCWWHMSGSLINCSVLNKIGGFDFYFRYYSDFDFILATFRAGYEHRLNHNKMVFVIDTDKSESSRCFDEFVDLFEDHAICHKYRLSVGFLPFYSRIFENLYFFLRRFIKSVIYGQRSFVSSFSLLFRYFQSLFCLFLKFGVLR